MATVTPGKTFTSNEVVTPTNLNALGVPTVTLADGEVGTAKIANGAVTQDKLNASVTLVPTGAIMPFAMNSAPSGWLAADGTEVSRTTYAALFAAIGTTYGAGTGGTTFNLPDLRGIFVRGSGSQTISGITYSGTLGTKQADDFKSHNHGMKGEARGFSGGASQDTWPRDQISAFGVAYTTTSSGGTETRPANIALLYCIKA